jgi:hypothetical protein
MAHYKPKTASPIYSEARRILLADPTLLYKAVFSKMTAPCSRGTLGAYGSSIRHEIGCELVTVNGHEKLEVDYTKYTAACKLYGVPALTVKSLLKTRTKNRDVVVKEQLPAPPAEIIVPMMDSSNHPNVMAACQAATETINLPPYQVVIESFSLGGDVKAKKAKLNKAFEEAELRMSEASAKAKELESLRAMLLTQISKLDDKIGAQRQIIDEATQAMDVMLTLVDAPDAVIDLVL